MVALKEKAHNIKDYKLLPEGAPYQLIEGEVESTVLKGFKATLNEVFSMI
ncbi:MAG: hypothetical protein VST71_12395 [Nitrospirota bacterium]|nr:hypothetical protein [Nitrospirota bacterium]